MRNLRCTQEDIGDSPWPKALLEYINNNSQNFVTSKFKSQMFNLKFVLGQRAFKSQRRLVNEIEHVSRVHFAGELGPIDESAEEPMLISSGNTKYSTPRDAIRSRHMRLMMIAQERGSMRWPMAPNSATRRKSSKLMMNKTVEVSGEKFSIEENSFNFPTDTARDSSGQPPKTAAPSVRADAKASMANSSGFQAEPAAPQGWLAQVEALARTYEAIDFMRPRILKLFLMIK